MEIDLIFKVAAIGIIVAILNQVLSRSGREEQATMTTLTGLVVVLMMLAIIASLVTYQFFPEFAILDIPRRAVSYVMK